MSTPLAMSPFGPGGLTLAMLATQAEAAACPPDARVGKRDLLALLVDARRLLQLPERAIAILRALLSFHPGTDLTGSGNLVVFPSNDKLSTRVDAMPLSSLRRHLAALVKTGFLIRRDSPNGKRYARKDADGAIRHAFGFDLRPLLVRLREFTAAAMAARTAKAELAVAREALRIVRRDAAKLIEAGVEAGIPHDWGREQERYDQLVRDIPRRGEAQDFEAVSAGFSRFVGNIRNLLKTHENAAEMSTSGARNERHIENSKHNPFESEEGSERRKEDSAAPPDSCDMAIRSPTYSLGFVLEACPDLASYIRPDCFDRNGLQDAANVARGALGIGSDAYGRAQRAMGTFGAAVAVGAILQRVDEIRSPGAYLRALTGKAERQEFSLGPVLMALRNRKGETSLAKAPRSFAMPRKGSVRRIAKA